MNGLLDWVRTPEGQGLLSMVAGGMAGYRQGQPINSIGRAGLSGLMGYGEALDRQTQMAQVAKMNELRDLTAKKTGLELTALERQMADAAKQREVLTNFYGGKTSGMGAGLQDQSGLPPEMRTGVTIPAMPGAAPANLPSGGRVNMFSHYQRLAEEYGRAGLGEAANAAAMTAEKYRPEYSQTPQQFMVGGKLVNALVSKDGTVKVLDGFGVKPDMVESNLGGKNVWLDKNTIQNGQAFAKTMTPGEVASNNLGWFNATKPEFNAESGAFIYRPSKNMPNGAAVQVPGAGDKPLTDSQAKAFLFGSRANESNKIMDETAKNGTDRPGWWKRTAEATVGMVPFAGDKLSDAAGSVMNFTQSADQQKVEQAQRDFINAVLRRESGAVISPSEFTNAAKQYFPQVGDSDAVLKQKAQNRANAIKGIMVEVPARSSVMRNYIAGGNQPSADNSDPLGLFRR